MSEEAEPTEVVEEVAEETTEDTTEKGEQEIWYCRKHGAVKPKWKSGRAFCPICSRLVARTPPPPEDEKEEEREEEAIDVIKPPEIEFQEKAIEFLKKNLPNVFGIDKNRVKYIIETIKQNPNVLFNPAMLHMHIKWFAPKANDYHLSLVINSMFSQLQHLLHPPSPPPIPMMAGSNSPAPTPYPMYGLTGFTNPQYTPSVPYMPFNTAYTQAQPQQRKVYKIAIDGQVIETDDPKEYLALKEWVEEQKRREEEREREKREHELRMKKLEEEIKKIARMDETEEKKKVPPSSHENELIKTLNSRLSTLERELSNLRKEKEELQRQLDEERRKHEVEKIRALEEELKTLRSMYSDPFKIVEMYEEKLRRLGYAKSGKSLLDILDHGVRDIGDTVKQLINRLPRAPQGQPVKYTEDERINKIRQIKEGIKESEELVQAEEDLIKAAEKLYIKNY